MEDKLIFEGEYLNGQRWNGKGKIYNTNNNLIYREEYINGQIFNKDIKENEHIIVFFVDHRKSSTTFGRVPIPCCLTEKVSTVIERFRIKAYRKYSYDRFIFRSKILNDNLTLMEAGILDNSEIYAIEPPLL